MDLRKMTAEFLEAMGYYIGQGGQDNVTGFRQTIGGENDIIEVWIPSFRPASNYRSQEIPYIQKFNDANNKNGSSRKICLLPSYEGISSDFREEASKLNVKVLVPIFFFDTQFKTEAAPYQTTSAALNLNQKGLEWTRKRIEQPFKILKNKTDHMNQELSDLIIERIDKRTYSGVDIVSGSAGMGKSVFFQVLYHKLYEKFQENKARQSIFPRPLPLIPEYRPAALAETLKGLVQGFLHSEFAAQIGYDAFVWMVANGFGIWLLDGLDEMIATDRDFFKSLQEIIEKPGSTKPYILLCVRDSLLTSNENLIEFVENESEIVTVYELTKWGQAQKRTFTISTLGDDKSKEFLSLIRNHEDLDNLSSTPFYLKLITDLFSQGKLNEPYKESDILDTAVKSIVDREYGKGLLDRKIIPPETTIELLQELAAEDAKSDFRGISGNSITDLTKVVLPIGLTPEEAERLTTNMLQIAVFSQGIEQNQVHFAQEIIAQYLYGKYLLGLFFAKTDHFIVELSSRILPLDWVTSVVLSENIQAKHAFHRIIDILDSGTLTTNSFRNILQIFLKMNNTPRESVKGLRFEHKDLAGIQFNGIDLKGVSFVGCNLTDTSFINCALNNCEFEGAVLNRTIFYSKRTDELAGADFGNMERLHSIRTGVRYLEMDHPRARKWLSEKTGIKEIQAVPCPAALQLRILFGKFVDPLGRFRRVLLSESDSMAGKQTFDKRKIIDAAVKFGYLSYDVHQHRYIRCEGDLLNELRNYFMNFSPSPRIMHLLNETCTKPKCPHLLRH